MKQRYPDARAMIQGGVPVALATDMNPNCWTESMQMVMTLACLQMRFSPEEALSAATINAAYAIGMGNEVGSIEVGKKADLAILSVPNYQHIPYRWGSNNVEMVIKAGKIVVCRDGKK
jgi:imidazolonepropionase